MSAVTLHTLESTAISPPYRLGFTLLMATVLHAAFILGSSFTSSPTAPPIQTLEITLAQHAVEKPPEKTDFLAQANQLASGSIDEKRMLSTTERSTFEDNKIQHQAALPVQAASQPEPIPPKHQAKKQPIPDKGNANQADSTTKAVVTTTAKKKDQQTPTQSRKAESAPAQPTAGQSTSLLARSLEIANLQAQIKMQQELLTKRPKVRRLSSTSTTIHDDAVYLDNWRRHIEKVGNMNYPEEARRQKIYGTLRVLVAIYADGSLKSIEITQSSGNKTLDNAAINIVQLASPFQPFSVEMRKNTDILEIIRSWKFEKNTQLY